MFSRIGGDEAAPRGVDAGALLEGTFEVRRHPEV